MRLKKINFIVWLLFFLFLTSYGNQVKAVADTWENVGDAEFTPGAVYEGGYSLAFHPLNGVPYVSFRDADNSNKVTVVKFDGLDWVDVGNAGFSAGSIVENEIIFNPVTNEPYVSFVDQEDSYNASVMRFNGSDWVLVGSAGFASRAASISIAFNPSTNEPYIAFDDMDSPFKANVMRFDGSSWVSVGIPDFSTGTAREMKIAFNPSTNEPYVAFKDSSIGSYRPTVMKFDGSDWVLVGNASFTSDVIDSISFAFNPSTSEPYFSYVDTSVSGASLYKFDGSSWTSVRTFGASYSTSIAFNPLTNEPYIAMAHNLFSGSGLNVYKFDGSNSVLIGDNHFYEGIYPLISFHPLTGEPYVISKNSSSGKVTVMKYNSNTVEDPVISPGGGTYGSSEPAIISTTTDGASIYYTVDGTTPNTGSTLYSGLIMISEDTTLKAIAVKDNMANSSVITGEYIIDPDAKEWNIFGSNFGVTNAENVKILVDGDRNAKYVLREDPSTHTVRLSFSYGVSWQGTTIGSSTELLRDSDMVRDTVNDIIYTAFIESDTGKITVTATNQDTPTTHVVVGESEFTAGEAGSVSLSIDQLTSEVYVSYIDIANSSNVSVMKYDGSSWELVGNAGFSPTVFLSEAPSIAINSSTNEPYVVFTKDSTSVMKYNGSSWVLVGSADFSLGYAKDIMIDFDPITNEPYVAYRDEGNLNKLAVMKYNGSNWESVGAIGISFRDIRHPSIAFHPITNEPYVAFSDFANFSRASVKKFNGSNWEDVGVSGFSSNFARYTSIAFDELTSEPYIAFADADFSDQVTVMNISVTKTPTASPGGGLYPSSQVVSLSSDTDGALIYYTTDGTTPTMSFNKYLTPITVSSNITLKAIAIKSGMEDSLIFDEDYEVDTSSDSSSSWDIIGSAGFSNSPVGSLSLAFDPDSGDPYIAYPSFSSPYTKIRVARFNSGAWENLGDLMGLSNTCYEPIIEFEQSSGDPYVLFEEDGIGLSVMRFTGSAWEYVGERGFVNASSSSYSIKFNPSTNEPYIAFQGDSSGGASVMKYDGSTWESVGLAEFSAGVIGSVDRISLEFSPTDNSPYVAYRDNENLEKATVMKYNGSSWENVGLAGFTDGGAYYPSLSFNSLGELFISFADKDNSYLPKVMKFNGSTWEDVGLHVDDSSIGMSMRLRFNNLTSQPYLAYSKSSRAIVKFFDGSDWILVGDESFSPGNINYLDFSFNPSTNEPYVAFRDEESSGRVTLMGYLTNVSNPEVSLSGGTYNSSQSVTLSTTTDGASIYYTIDGSTPSTGSTLYSGSITISEDTTLKAIAVKDGVGDSDIITESYTIDRSSPVYRFYSPTGKSHFFTTSESEKNNIINNYSNDWNYEGIAYYAYPSSDSGLTPVYRFYSPTGKSHFFTTSESEKNRIIANYPDDWNYEGIAYYAYSASGAGLNPTYRFYSPTGKSHFFTISESEKDRIIANYPDDWNFEGVAWYVPEE